MTKRQARKIFRYGNCTRYGRWKASGHRSRRRGRRRLLRLYPFLRDRSSLPFTALLDLLDRELAEMESYRQRQHFNHVRMVV